MPTAGRGVTNSWASRGSDAEAARARRGLLGSLATAGSSQLVLVISGIVVARLLGVHGRGELAVIMLVPSALGQLGTLGLPLALAYEVASKGPGSRAAAHAFRPWIVAQVVVLTGLQTALLWLLVDPAERTAVLVATPIMAAIVAQQYGLAILQGRRCFGAFNLARVAPATLYALALAALAVADRAGVLTVVVVWTAANVAVALPLLVVFARHGRRGPATVRPLAAFGVRALLGTSPSSDALRLDQAVVALMLPRAALGLYVVGLAFTNLPRFISQSIGMVALPVTAASRQLTAPSALIRRYLTVFLVTAGVVVGVLEVAVGELVPRLFGAEFAPAVPAARILLAAALVVAARRVLSDVMQGLGRPGVGAFAEGTYLLTAVLLMPFLTAVAGIEGVAAATAVSALTSLLAVVAASLWRRSAQRAVPEHGVPELGVPELRVAELRVAGPPTEVAAAR